MHTLSFHIARFGGLTVEHLLTALKAVAEPTRLRLLALCAHMDLTVSQLVQVTGQSQPRLSRHLKLLSDAGLLTRVREGSWVFYRIAPDGPAAGLAQLLVDSLDHQDPAMALDFARLEKVRQLRAETAAAYFSRNAARWSEIRALHVEEQDVEQALLGLLPEAPIGNLLDIGTGTGRILEVVQDRVQRGLGIDLSPDMLTLARANLDRHNLRHCSVQHGDMYQLDLPGGNFDVVTIHQVLHFAEAPEVAVAEAARVLKPGGQVIIVDFYRHDLQELRDNHEHRWLGFHDGQILDWCQSAKLAPKAPQHLPGDPLTVGLWTAQKTGPITYDEETAA